MCELVNHQSYEGNTGISLSLTELMKCQNERFQSQIQKIRRHEINHHSITHSACTISPDVLKRFIKEKQEKIVINTQELQTRIHESIDLSKMNAKPGQLNDLNCSTLNVMPEDISDDENNKLSEAAGGFDPNDLPGYLSAMSIKPEFGSKESVRSTYSNSSSNLL